MPVSQKSDNQVEGARLTIEGVRQHPEIKKRMARLGYNDSKMNEGVKMITDFKQYGVQQAENYGRQKDATARYRQERANLKALYQEHLTLARVALKEDITAGDVLDLWGPRQRNAASWLGQVSDFYTEAGRYAKALAKYNISAEAITQGQAMVQSIEATRVEQNRYRSAAQIATQHRQQALKELKSWVSELRAIARVALKDEPQYLEALGQVVK